MPIQGTKIFNYVTPILNGTYYIVPNPDLPEIQYIVNILDILGIH